MYIYTNITYKYIYTYYIYIPTFLFSSPHVIYMYRYIVSHIKATIIPYKGYYYPIPYLLQIRDQCHHSHYLPPLPPPPPLHPAQIPHVFLPSLLRRLYRCACVCGGGRVCVCGGGGSHIRATIIPSKGYYYSI